MPLLLILFASHLGQHQHSAVISKVSKNIVQRMGANKSIDVIQRVSKATNGIKAILENFDEIAGLHKLSARHTTRNSYQDELKMIEDISKVDPFNYMESRHFESFPDIKRSPLRHLKIVDFHHWLRKMQNGLYCPQE